jgi:purine nucleoside permease
MIDVDTLTLEQMEALRKVYAREAADNPPTFEQFLATVAPTFGLDGAVTVPWCGMWLLVETDGYTHS